MEEPKSDHVTAAALPFLVELLKSGAEEQQKEAARSLGVLASEGSHEEIAEAGAIPPLVNALKSVAVREEALATLWELASEEENRVRIADAGAIPLLVDLLKDGSCSLSEAALGTLSELGVNTGNQAAIARSGGIEIFVELLSTGTAEMKEASAGALASVAEDNAEIQSLIVHAGAVPALAELLKGTDGARNSAAAVLTQIVKLDPAGVIPLLVDVLRHSPENVQEMVMGALIGLEGGSLNLLAAAGAIPLLVDLLVAESAWAQTMAASLLWDLSTPTEHRAAIVEAGAIPLLVAHLSTDTGTSVKAAGALHNLAQESSQNRVIIGACGALAFLADLLVTSEHQEVIVSALGLLAAEPENAPMAEEAGVKELVEELAKEGSDRVQEAARVALAMISAASPGPE